PMSKLRPVIIMLVVLPFGCIAGRVIEAAIRGALTNVPANAILFWCTTGGVIGAVINGRKGHGSFIGFVGGAIFGPVFVWLFLLDKSKKHRKCPYCSEEIARAATVCRYCKREVE